MNFTAIDFETANYNRDSACQIGLVVVRDNRVTDRFSSLINPETDHFVARFTREIHGISARDVRDSPNFGQLWPELIPYIEQAPLLVAHNAPFDMGVLRSCLEKFGIHARLPDAYCTLKQARDLLPGMANYKLDTLSRKFGVELQHHEALSDANAAAVIAIELERIRAGSSNLD